MEPLELLRKLALTSVVPVFMQSGKTSGTLFALIVEFVVAWAFLLLHFRLQPYVDPELDFAQQYSLAITCITIFTAIMLEIKALVPDVFSEEQEIIVSVVVGLLNIGMLIVIAWMGTPVGTWVSKTASTFKREYTRRGRAGRLYSTRPRSCLRGAHPTRPHSVQIQPLRVAQLYA